ncbi:hypothetical protein [Brevibacillus porteri]|uniref:hypothetical protein n=1 Tax=Brevibacillus porteri TaxID=2126350 RepID=UPI003D261403
MTKDELERICGAVMWDLQMQATYHPELFHEKADIEANVSEKFTLLGVNCRVSYDEETKTINVFPDIQIEKIAVFVKT